MNYSSLLENLFESFPNTTPPESDSLISHICPDCIKLKNDFKGKKWQEISTETISEHFDDLPLFTLEGFYYYLPAYIKNVLKQKYAYLTIAEFLVYCLYCKGDEERRLNFENKMEKFSKKQISFLVSFLEFLLKDSQYSSFHQDIMWSLQELEKFK